MANKKNYNVLIPIDFMSDPRTEKLIDECGYKGLGILFASIMAVEQFYLIKPKEELVSGLVGHSAPSKLKRKVLHDYGFFEVEESGRIMTNLRAGACAVVRANADAKADAEVCAPPSFSIQNKKQETTDQKDNIAAADAADAAVGFIKKVLLKPEASLWKQTLLMQCPYSSLLSKYWTQAVELFIRHTVAEAKAEMLYSESEIRRYFNRYVMGNNQATDRLRQTLSNLAASDPSASETAQPQSFEDPVAADGSRSYNGRPLPSQAPPRPSATAEYNYATDVWMELS